MGMIACVIPGTDFGVILSDPRPDDHVLAGGGPTLASLPRSPVWGRGDLA
jgi:hypothetical protein